MRISYNWLRQYAEVSASPEELGEILTMGGLEVEDVEQIGTSLEGVVTGHVLKTWRHPNADRLTLCEVDLGGEAPVQIACGAPNVVAGQLVPVATVGTTLLLPSRLNPQEREPVTINRAKIRGEISEGMICAEDELGLSDDHSGIMVLAEDAKIGRSFADYLRTHGREASDAVLDVGITPNRPDAASHIGVARDAAALTSTPLTVPRIPLPQNGGEAAERVQIEILAPEGCPRYVAMLVEGVEIVESPTWLKRRLTAIGLRPRNVVVDVTNFVLHECGQPLHAFDYDEIGGARIRVRKTEEETKFTTLDSKVRLLPAGTLMICDADRDVAVAGIMGGENSEVTEKTRNVLIESAYFDPASIRRTSKALGLQTDASYRFERGVDRDGQVWAAARAAHLIAELAGGTIVDGMVDAHPVRFERRQILLRPSRVRHLLGVDVPPAQTASLLESIGFDVSNGEALTCTVPTFRPDVEREVDLIEEVVRLYGYDNIPEPQRSVAPASAPRDLPVDRLRRQARSLLAGLGHREMYTNSMQRAETAKNFLPGEGEIVETLNPISQEMAALRPTLLPGALQVMSFNRKHGRRSLRFFELGHVYRKTEQSDTLRGDGLIPGYDEHESLIVTASGPATVHSWDVEERPLDLFDLKGVVEMLLSNIRLPGVRLEPGTEQGFTRDRLDVFSEDTPIGVLGRVSDDVAAAFDLKEPAFFAELDWDRVVALSAPMLERRYGPVSRFPIVERDIAVVVKRDEPVGRLLDSIRRAGGELLRQVDVFDLYEGENVGEGRKSVAFSLRFGADRTLTDEEVDEIMSRIVSSLEERHGASLRS